MRCADSVFTCAVGLTWPVSSLLFSFSLSRLSRERARERSNILGILLTDTCYMGAFRLDRDLEKRENRKCMQKKMKDLGLREKDNA